MRYALSALGGSILGLIVGLVVGVVLGAILGLSATAGIVEAAVIGGIWGLIVANRCARSLHLTGQSSDMAQILGAIVGAVLLWSWSWWGTVVNLNALAPAVPTGLSLSDTLAAYDPGSFLLATAALFIGVYGVVVGGTVLVVARAYR